VQQWYHICTSPCKSAESPLLLRRTLQTRHTSSRERVSLLAAQTIMGRRRQKQYPGRRPHSLFLCCLCCRCCQSYLLSPPHFSSAQPAAGLGLSVQSVVEDEILLLKRRIIRTMFPTRKNWKSLWVCVMTFPPKMYHF
jgi:hypothetical protein